MEEQNQKKAYTPHDRLFKQLVETFFEEFMLCFFPDIQQGKIEGKLEGERLAKLELARKLLAEGLVSIEKIVELTGLSREDIQSH